MSETATSAAPAASSAPSTTLLGGTPTDGNTAAAAIAATDPGAPGSNGFAWADKDGKFSDGWIDHLPEELRGEASLRTMPTLHDLAKSYVSTKKAIGRKLEMPGEGATPEEVAHWRKVTGAPDKPEGYLGETKTLRPADIPETMWDAATEKAFVELAHKHSLPPAAVKEIVALHGQQIGVALKNNAAAYEKHVEGERDILRKEWGKDFDMNHSNANRMLTTLGLPVDRMPSVSELGRAMAKGVALFSESQLVKGDTVDVSTTIQDRMRDIQDLTSQSRLAREYRGEFGEERQRATQKLLHDLMNAGT